MAKTNPVEYAEKVLGVHLPWKEAEDRLKSHGEASEFISLTRGHLREAKRLLADREMELSTLAYADADFSKLSATAQKEQLKRKFADDNKCVEFRRSIDHYEHLIETSQAELRHHEIGLNVLTSRMTELGGLLHFYAEAKAAETAATQPAQPTQPAQETGQHA